MPIRKFGTEPAKTEVRPEDNDSETLDGLKAEAALPPEIIDSIERAVNDPTYGERRGRPQRH